MKITVIGSGMSGLTAAAYLAQAGHQVTVYEQFPDHRWCDGNAERRRLWLGPGSAVVGEIRPWRGGARHLAGAGRRRPGAGRARGPGVSFPDYALETGKVRRALLARERLKELFPKSPKGWIATTSTMTRSWT